jgi:diguanylate cyclase (GGDEF)-like protein
MSKNGTEITLARAAFQREWRTAALPVAFVILSVELQQHWQGGGDWVYLAAVALISICWISALFGQAWAARGAGVAIDAVFLLLLIGGGWLTITSGEKTVSDPIATLMFWAPLFCVWWALSLDAGFSRLGSYMLALYGGIFFFHANAETQILERVLLGILLVYLVRFAGERYSRFPTTGLLRQARENPLVDTLTGVASPVYFEAELAHTAAISDRYKQPFSLIACRVHPLDGDADFASENGQKSLIIVARALVDLVRFSDTVCRWENGKFFVLLPNTKLENAQKIAKKIRDSSHSIISDNKRALIIQSGVCEHSYGDDPMQTFTMADDALSQQAPPDTESCKS